MNTDEDVFLPCDLDSQFPQLSKRRGLSHVAGWAKQRRPMNIAYYISGHGFGHAVRSVEVLRRLIALGDGARIHVRTTAPDFLFAAVKQHVDLRAAGIDSGVVEASPLEIDVKSTLNEIRRLYTMRESLIDAERDYLRSHRVELVVGDIPYLAATVARAVKRPCVLLGNFTWDWIYEPYFLDSGDRDLQAFVEDCHAEATRLLRLPLSHPVTSVPEVVDVPLIARRSRWSRSDVRRRLSLAEESRPVILVVMRGGIAESIATRVVDGNPDMVFLCLQQPFLARYGNAVFVSLSSQLEFADLLAASDAVVSKLGYGIVSDAIANGTRMLWPERLNFREDDIMGPAASERMPCRKIPLAEFASGQWREPLQALLRDPPAAIVSDINGADCCARHILSMLPGSER